MPEPASPTSSSPQPPTAFPAPLWAPRSCERAILPHGCGLPPPPPGCKYVPVRFLGIVVADDDLRRRVDRFFHAPMIVLALLVLPLLVLDYIFIRETGEGTPSGATSDWMWLLVIGGLTLIWIAFTAEFIIKIAIAESRWEYLRRNWLDLIIIVIPLLRPLRVAAVARTTQAFRLRGVGFKLARYLFTLFIGMEATNRMMERIGLKPRKQRKKPEQMTRHELMAEVARLRRLTDDWQTWHERQQAYLAQCSQPAMSEDCPRESLLHDGLAADVPESSPQSRAEARSPRAPYNPATSHP